MKTIINIKTDNEVKENAKILANEFGLSLSAIINSYLKEFIRRKEIHLSVSPKMTAGLEQLLGKVEYDIKRSKNLSRSFVSQKEMDEHLDSL